MYTSKNNQGRLEPFDGEEQIGTTKISVEVDYGEFEEREIPIENQAFVAITDTALKLMTMYDKRGKSAFCIYCCLLSHRNRTNNKCFPSISTIVKETKTSDKRIKEILNLLEQDGYLLINTGGRNKSNNYYFPKEWFFKYFKDDIRQANAKRNRGVKAAINSDAEYRKTKKQLIEENKELVEKVNELEKENATYKLFGKSLGRAYIEKFMDDEPEDNLDEFLEDEENYSFLEDDPDFS